MFHHQLNFLSLILLSLAVSGASIPHVLIVLSPQVFPELPITELMGRILGDETYQKWQQIRNVLAHRVATAGRTVQHGDSSFSGLLSL